MHRLASQKWPVGVTEEHCGPGVGLPAQLGCRRGSGGMEGDKYPKCSPLASVTPTGTVASPGMGPGGTTEVSWASESLRVGVATGGTEPAPPRTGGSGGAQGDVRTPGF